MLKERILFIILRRCCVNNRDRWDRDRDQEIAVPTISNPTPLFSRFSELEDGKSERTEILITDGTPKMMRHMFAEKVIIDRFHGFWQKTLVFHRSSSCLGQSI